MIPVPEHILAAAEKMRLLQLWKSDVDFKIEQLVNQYRDLLHTTLETGYGRPR